MSDQVVTTAGTPSGEAGKSVRIGRRLVPVVLPSLRDPRLHLASVIISIHVLGQVALDFRVSVPQILAAILSCAAIEVAWTLRTTGRLVWPASAMLTGSGVALILRLVDAEAGDHWTWQGWHVFAGVAAVSLLTKYLVRAGGSQVFNPSNVGLVAAFLVLGSDRIEPLDFWWGPLDGWLALAYAVILVGGLLITSRLGLLGLAVTFWAVLGGGLALLSATGHCMTAAWSLEPVCGWSFWRVVVGSPELLVFLFFMITDPRTVPAGRVPRRLFGAAVALASLVLIAPQTTEYGAKVGLLAGLVLVTPLRGLFEALPSRWRVGTPGPAFTRGMALGSALVLVVVGLLAAGGPARVPPAALHAHVPGPPAVEVDVAELPVPTVDPAVAQLSGALAGVDPGELAVTLAEALAVEAEARRGSDPSLLRSVDHGARLVDMERRIEIDAVAGRRVEDRHHFSSLHLQVVHPQGPQSGAGLGFEAVGDVESVVHDEKGTETSRSLAPFHITFVLSPVAGDRWLIVDAVDGSGESGVGS